MSTPQRSPRSFSVAHASSRRPGAGVPGSSTAKIFVDKAG